MQIHIRQLFLTVSVLAMLLPAVVQARIGVDPDTGAGRDRERPGFTNFSGGEYCIQVITYARNPETGEVQEFGSPCEVPSGWEIVSGPAGSSF